MLGISLDLPQMSNFSQAFCDVLSACLVFEPSQRISAKALNAMDFFSEKSQDSERLAVFKYHELESIDARFARLSHAAPIPILSDIPSTPTITSQWDYGFDASSPTIPTESSFLEMSLSSDLHEHRSHLEILCEALDTKLVEVVPPDSPHLKALSLEPKVMLAGVFHCICFRSCMSDILTTLTLQCVLLDESNDDGRLIVLIEAIDRPRLLNDITSIITEESESNLHFFLPFYFSCFVFFEIVQVLR
jgi:serine/threonine protein kinase